MEWKAYYWEGDELHIYTRKWASLPPEGLLKLVIQWPTPKDEVEVKGWDAYWMIESRTQIAFGTWNDGESGEIFANIGRMRILKTTGMQQDTGYIPRRKFNVPPQFVKKALPDSVVLPQSVCEELKLLEEVDSP